MAGNYYVDNRFAITYMFTGNEYRFIIKEKGMEEILPILLWWDICDNNGKLMIIS